MKILWEGEVKSAHSERESKKFYFLLHYFFADEFWYESAMLLLHLVQNLVHGGCSTREEVQFLSNPLRQTCIGILGRDEIKLTKSVQTLRLLNFCIFQKFLLASEFPLTDSRTRASCVIPTFVPANTVDAWRLLPDLILN